MKPLTTAELSQMMDRNEDFTLINVLSEDDFRQKHIPHSVNVPLNTPDFVEVVERIAGGKDRKIVVYCGSFECTASPTAARMLEEAGFTNVYDYEGGLKDWEQAGHPIESGLAGAQR